MEPKFIKLDSDTQETVTKTTHYLLILDRSSSMNSCLKSTVDGFNEQLDTIRQLQEEYSNQEFIVSFVTFASYGDIQYEAWRKAPNEVQKLTENTYHPRGMTCMHDAVGHSLKKLHHDLGEELKDENTKVIVSIFTDGAENASRDFRGTEIADLSQEMQDSGQWTFTYIGANHDVSAAAKSMNIPVSNTVMYKATKENATMAHNTVSQGLKTYAKSRSLDQEDLLAANYYSKDDDVIDITND